VGKESRNNETYRRKRHLEVRWQTIKKWRMKNNNSGLSAGNFIPPVKITAIHFMLGQLTRARANSI
jgi:hypothetical protein